MKKTPPYIAAVIAVTLVVAYIVSYGMARVPQDGAAEKPGRGGSALSNSASTTDPAGETLPGTTTPSIKPNFNRSGNLVEGKTKGSWHLVYEEPGKPALKAELVFGPLSLCDAGNGSVACGDVKWVVGDRVRVEGELESGAVAVVRIKKI